MFRGTTMHLKLCVSNALRGLGKCFKMEWWDNRKFLCMKCRGQSAKRLGPAVGVTPEKKVEKRIYVCTLKVRSNIIKLSASSLLVSLLVVTNLDQIIPIKTYGEKSFLITMYDH